jgi:hypothetical protein
MTGIDAAADAVTGGLIGRAVEPAAGDAHHGAHGERCLNCGAALIGEHCHACGQAAHVHRTAGAIGHEIAHGVFHFEGKMPRTLPMLVFRPGELTRRYIAGERARFVSPLAIFLFSVFLLFAIVANLPGWHFADTDFLKPGFQKSLVETRLKLTEQLKEADKTIADARQDIAEERQDTAPDADKIARREKRIAGTQQARAGIVTAINALPATDGEPDVNISTIGDANWFEKKFQHARENPKLVLYKMKTSAYKYSWALIPLSIPFLWLLFPFSRRFGLYDHAVFATYSLSFMSLMVITLALLGALGVPWTWLALAGTLIPIVHIYKQMKGAYSLGRWSGLIRTFLLLTFIFWVIVPVFAVLLVYFGVAD